MGFLLLGNLSVNDQGTGRFLITKASKAPKGKSESPWSLHNGSFWKIHFINPPEVKGQIVEFAWL